jgi:predicted secreted hydrolase
VIGRRRFLLAAGSGGVAAAAAASGRAAPAGLQPAASQPVYASVEPRALVFPRDAGAHPDYRTEWWYLTGRLDAPARSAQPPIGVQLTFFRIRTAVDPANPSRFAAHQLILAHAALADPRRGALLHEERIARTGFGLASASTRDTAVDVDGWRLQRDGASGAYLGVVQGAQFTLELHAQPTQPRLLQGERGYSPKGFPDPGPGPRAASFYYSEPQLALQVRIRGDGEAIERSGRGWLDHEWSSTLLPPRTAGWDWAGFNLADGSALTVFRIRRGAQAGGDAAEFAYAALRPPDGPLQEFAAAQVRLEPLAYWTSPRTRARYPVAQRLHIGARVFESRPLMDDQELDARAGSGVVYWEGASALLEDGRAVGAGYLELTGYAGKVMGGS